MDVVDYRGEIRISAGKMTWLKEGDRWREKGGAEELVEVVLEGKSPWGFTLRGGREHREPLVITKVEAGLRLLAGDEMVSINGVVLGGSRKEAVSLVKSSHKTLALVVRRKNRFKGKNDAMSRPHSWHSSKLTEEEAEPPANGPSLAPVWQPMHETRSKEVSGQGDQSNLHQLSSRFHSVITMERPECPSHHYPPGRLSPNTYTRGPEPLTGGSTTRDAAFSCFSSSASPPLPNAFPPTRKGTSTENIFFKGLQSEGARQAEHPRYLQPPLGNGGWERPRAEEQPASRMSLTGRSGVGPVWQVPERRKTQSSPPPPPPLRSDSFAATKVFPYSAGPVSRRRSHGKALDGQNEVNDQRAFKPHIAVTQKVPEAARQGFNSEPAKDSLYPGVVADHNHNQLHPSKLFSLSSNDVRQAQSYSAYLANHQRQYSDESTFYLHTRSVPQVKQQSVGSYYRSLQDLPTNASGRKPVRLLTASAASSSAHPSLGNSGPTRYCMSARQGGSKERQMGDLGVAHCNNGKDRSSVSSLKSSVKAKYSLPHSQLPGVDNTEHSSLSQAGKGPLHQHPELSSSGKSSRSDNGQKKGERQHTDIKRQLSAQQASDQKANLPVHQDPWVPQEDHRISPSKTPFLHSLAQESRTLVPRQPMVGNTDTTSPQDAGESGRSLVVKPPAVSITLALDPGEGKACRRGDRYATTLRNQIQQKRAQLQKSRSAATLTCGEGEEDEPEDWRSTETSAASSDGSFSNTYKDHLKEAQARVLQATSFQRRDLEPVGAETATGKGVAAGQLFRIGGRKRFPLAKRVHSFSEPDKINKLGTAEGEPHPESFRERREFFESKPAFSRPVLRSGQSSSALDQNEAGGAKARLPLQEAHLAHQAPDLDPLLGEGREQALLEQQRLGTFAEYQATWSLQRKPAAEAKTKGRYHSAENILDADVAETAVCIHERSRSSPSADTQKSSVAWRDPVINSCTTPRHALPGSSSDRGKTESNVGHQAGRPDAGLQPTEPAGNEGQARHGPGPPALPDHAADRSHTALATGTPSHSPSPGSHLPAQTPLSSASTRPGPDTTSSSASSQEFRPCAREESSSSSSLLPAPPLPLSGPGPQRDGSCAQSQGHAQSSRPRSPASLPIAPSQTPEATGARELPPPLSSSSSSSFPRLASSKMAALSLPPTDLDLLLAPSPQFEPRRITNRPPAVCAVDPFPARTENGAAEGREDTSGPPARKVPVRIVHAESSERRSSAYLAHDSAGPAPLSGPVPSSPQPPSSSLSSLFGAYMRPAAAAHRETPPAQQDVQREGVRESLEVHGTEEDAKREELARDIMGRDKALADILDQRGMKTTMDLMEGLFPQEQQLLDGSHPRRRAPAAHRLSNSSARSAEERAEMGTCAPASLVPSSSYYNTSAPKAELLIKMKDMQVELEEEEDSEEELDVDLVSKKRELISSLAQKLEVLHEARQSLQEDVEDNEALGREVEAGVQRLCQPNQLDKFRMFVGDLDKVVSLLLSLSGRLARVENALNGLEEQAAPEEKRTLTEKRALLLRQHEDARELKENLDRREQLVTQAMEAQLDARGLDDYRHFVKMKSALIIEQRKLEDKVKLGEEQLKCLLDSLPSEQRLPL